MFEAPYLPFLLKLAAAAATGMAAILAVLRMQRDDAIKSLRQDVRDAALLLRRDSAEAAPPTVLVTGFRGHGKSSFVNTVCRALAAEAGPLLLRAETAPPGPGGPATLAPRVVRAGVTKGVGDEEDVVEEADVASVIDMVDGTALPDPLLLTRADVEASFGGGNAAAPPAECVVIVFRCSEPSKDRHIAVKKLTEISSAVRERGLNLVVVLTHTKEMESIRQAKELRREVAFRARTDCVYFIDNYTAGKMLDNVRRPPAIRNDFETHFTALAIIRQCVEFAKLHRSRSLKKKLDPSSSTVTFSVGNNPHKG